MQSVTWDGRDAHGQTLPSGVYFLRFTAGDQRTTVRAVRLD